ncbi:MAG TPA: hypothetical protein VE987_04095, partial [Polyangiaceae bacterium]|nr:hypothetical protein [Polyangiaceae bacterium]
CGNACPATAPLCSEGTCVVSCVPPTTQCGVGRAATCSNLSTNKVNCGNCMATCGGNLTCSNSSCVCAAPFTDCAGTCTNLQTDNNNCGTCGTTCVLPSTCQNGACL